MYTVRENLFCTLHYISFYKKGEHTLSVAVVVVGLLKREMEAERIVGVERNVGWY